MRSFNEGYIHTIIIIWYILSKIVQFFLLVYSKQTIKRFITDYDKGLVMTLMFDVQGKGVRIDHIDT
jgi:hypothetical protein